MHIFKEIGTRKKESSHAIFWLVEKGRIQTSFVGPEFKHCQAFQALNKWCFRDMVMLGCYLPFFQCNCIVCIFHRLLRTSLAVCRGTRRRIFNWSWLRTAVRSPSQAPRPSIPCAAALPPHTARAEVNRDTQIVGVFGEQSRRQGVALSLPFQSLLSVENPRLSPPFHIL